MQRKQIRATAQHRARDIKGMIYVYISSPSDVDAACGYDELNRFGSYELIFNLLEVSEKLRLIG